jgi:drug/metabolite transporter (DMT)-like permease
MAKRTVSATAVLAIALMVVGVGLAVWGYQLSSSFTSQIAEVVTGAETDKVMALYIGGAVSIVVGVYMLIKS